MSGTYERKDHLYNRAKEEGFRSRAAYKLEELDQKYGLLKPSYKVLDLGAWPGGWLQVASKRVGPDGLVIGVDLVEIEDLGFANIKVIKGDLREEATLDRIVEMNPNSFDLVVSDMSPKLSGIPEVDRIAAVALAELALFFAQRFLATGGNLVIKVFKGNETEAFVKTSRSLFNKVARCELKSTRKSSNEFYLVNLGLKRPQES